MEGPDIRYDPASINLLELHLEVYQIFQCVGWVDYFQRLRGFYPQQVLEFERNLWDDYSTIQGA